MPKQKKRAFNGNNKGISTASNANKKMVSREFLKLVLKRIMPTAAIMPTPRAMLSPTDKIITQVMVDIKTIDCK